MLKQFTFLLALLLSFATVQGQDWMQIGTDIDGEAEGDGSGSSVSISADGSIVAIGAIFNEGKGHVRVYKNIEGVWEQIGDDIDGESDGDLFGNSVSISADGSVVAIGARFNSENGERAGHVRVYKNIGGVWEQLGDDIDGKVADDRFGTSVSISADGSIVAAGAPYNSENGIESGHVRVYKNIEGVWEQLGDDIGGEAKDDWSGRSVSISADGSVVAIGAPYNSGNGEESGHVRIYSNLDGVWTQVGEDIDGEQEGERSGNSVSLSADGSIVAIGAPLNNGNGVEAGQIRVYRNEAGSWVKMGGNINGEAAKDWFGWNVSLNADGSVVGGGSPYNTAKGNETGQVCVYQNIDGEWNKVGEDIEGEAEGDKFGWAVSLSADGSVVSIGALANDGNGSYAGHVRVLKNNYLAPVEELEELGISIYPNPTNDIIHLKFGENDIQKLTVLDVTGRNIFVKTNVEQSETIDFSSLTNGIYFIKIASGDKVFTTKIIKETFE